MTASASPLAALDPAAVRRVVLPNGLTVLVRQDRSAPVIAIVTYVKAGYFDETDDVVGIAHVLEHMFFKGTDRRGVGAIARETKSLGGYLNAHTIYDHTSYYTVLPSSAFAAGLDIQADAYAESVIDADELAKELEVIIQEAKRKSDNPTAVATETLYELLHDVHRMRRWRIGREDGLRALRREHLVGFYRNFYRPSSTILSIVGDVDPDVAIAEVERRYGRLPAGEPARTPGPTEPERREARWRELAGDVAQSQLVLGWRTVPGDHEDAPRLDLAAAVLATGRASRLYRAVRERQLVSSVSAYNYTPRELGVFVVHAESRPERLVEAARAIDGQLRALRDGGIDERELERARRIYEARWLRRLESMDGQANYFAEWESQGDVALGERYLEALLSATPEEVTEAFRRWVDLDAAAAVIYRPTSAPPVARDLATWQAILTETKAVVPAAEPSSDVPAAPALARPPVLEREEAGVRVYRTAGGVPVLVRRRPGAPIAYVGLTTRGGAREEPPHLAGLSSLLVRTSIKGTRTRTAAQLASDAERLGGSISPGNGTEGLGWSISVPTRHLDAAIELLADVVQAPALPAEALETERAMALDDLASLRDDMYRWPMRLATQAAFEGHAYGVPTTGTEETLAAITLEDVRAWHGAQVLSGDMVIAVVGDMDEDEVAALVAARFGALVQRAAAPMAPPAWPVATVTREDRREKAQSALAILFPGPPRRDPRRHAAHLLAGIASGLGGRFFDELRDKQSLAYTVQAFAAEREAAGLFMAYIATSPEKEETARRGLLAEFAKLRERPVTAEELQRAQVYAVGTHAIRRQGGGAVLADMLDAWLFGEGLHEIAQHDASVRAVTAADIQALANAYFDEGRRVEGIVRGEQRGMRSEV
jgi:zinc protease